MSTTVADVVSVLEARYHPSWAEDWDRVGLVCGAPDAPVRKVLFAVDPVEAVVDEALEWGADLIVTHHPLYLRGTSSVAATDAKGRVVHRLVTGGAALFVAHTNADVARPGVSDALADVLGLTDTVPLLPAPSDPLDKIVTFVPRDQAEAVLDAVAAAGAGGIGNYSRCANLVPAVGTFRPEPGAYPAIGSVGRVEYVDETRLEVVAPRGRRAAVLGALVGAHPYEEPAWDVIELATVPSPRGLGRVGVLPAAEPFSQFVRRVAAALPVTPVGVRAAGSATREIRAVAVVGGAGDTAFEAVRRSGADAYVTADLRHHPASEALADAGFCLVDAGHWATEWPWLPQAAGELTAALSAGAATVETRVSTIVTDPWELHAVGGPPDPRSTS